MNLNQLLDRQTVRQYLESLKAQGAPQATLDRKLASIRKFTAWALPKKGFNLEGQRVTPPRWPEGLLGGGLTGLYSKYTNSRLASYLHLSILVLFTAAMAVFGYNQIFKEAGLGQAYPQAPSPATPNRYLSFQARLTDSSDNPITVPTDVRFIIYNDETASGSAKLWEELRYIDPDQDGIFSVTLGTETAIASSVFTENVNLWLGVTVETDAEATPRQRIATVGYALNAETLQGFPPSASASADQIPVLTQEGDLVLAAASPQVYSTSGTFAIKGQAMTITTDTGTNGSITIQPDGTGQLLLTTSTTSQNSIRATNANLTSGHLISGYVGNDTATGDLLNLSSGASETEKFAVDRSGNVALAGDLTITGGNITNAITADSTLTVTSDLTALSNLLIDNQGDLRLYEGDGGGSNYTGFQAPATLAGDVLYTLPTADAAVSGYILSSNASGTLSWTSAAGAAASAIPWVEGAGILYPKNSTVDLLVGGQATTSAKFAVLNMNSGTPVASISANSGNIAAYLTGDGTLATTNRNSLTIGNSSTYNTTGNVLINPNGTGNVGIGTTNPENLLHLNSTLDADYLYITKSDSRRLYAGYEDTGGVVYTYNNSNTNITGLYGDGSGNGIAFINNSSGTAKIWLAGSGSSYFTGGSVGIGTTAPDARLEVNAEQVGKALVIFDQDSLDQDILAASSSGTTKFVINNSGNVGIGTTAPSYKLSIADASVSGRGINIDQTSTSGNAYGIVSAATGASTQNIAGIFEASGATTNYAIYIGGPGAGASNYALYSPVAAQSYFGGNVGIGTTAPDARLEINHATGDNLRLTYNDANGSAAAYTDFSLASDGDLTIDSAGGAISLASGDDFNITAATDLIFGGATSLGETTAANDSGAYLVGTFDEFTYSASANVQDVLDDLDAQLLTLAGLDYWRLATGALSPINDTLDLLVGSNATASAKFAVLNMNSGTPVASVSAGAAGAAYLTAAGTLATTAKQSLILGDSGTGIVSVNNGGLFGVGTTAPIGKLHVTGQCVAKGTLIRRKKKKRRGDDEDDWENIPVEDIQPGDEVLTLDELTGEFVTSVVEDTMDKGRQTVFILTTESGKTIATTAGHPYLMRSAAGLAESEVKQEKSNNQQQKKSGGRVENVQKRIIHSSCSSLENFQAMSNDNIPVMKFFVNNNSVPEMVSPLKATGLTKIAMKNALAISKNKSDKSRDIFASNSIDATITAHWTKVNDLRPGDAIATLDGWEKIVSIKKIGRKHTYDLQIKNTHNFVANRIVAHNTTGKALAIFDELGDQDIFTASASGTPKFTLDNSGRITLLDGVAHTIDDVSGDLTLTSNSATVSIADGLAISGTLDANGIATIGDGGETITLNGSSITLTGFNSCTALETDGSGVLACGSDGGGGTIWWTENLGALSPINSTLDVLIGSNATASAKFAVLNVDGSGPATATVSGNLIVMPRNGAGGRVGIGTDNPTAKLDIGGSTSTIANSSGDITIDSAADIVLDADGADVILKDGGTTFATFTNTGTPTLQFGANASNITLPANGAADDLTIQVTGAFDSSLILSSAGTGTDAIAIQATAGGIDINAAAEIQIDGALTNIGSGTYTLANGDNDLGVEGDIEANGTVLAADFSCSNCLDFPDFEDTMDLDTSLTINQATNTWTQNYTGTTGTGLTYNANSLTTGTALSLASTSTAGGASGVSKVLNISRSGANAQLAHTAYGLYSAVTNTNATSGTNIAGYFSASGATTANYGLIVESGNVGIGTTAPTSKVDTWGTTADSSSYWGTTVSDANTYPQFALRAAAGTVGAETAVLAARGLGAISFRGYNGSAWTGSKAWVSGYAEENWGTTANGTYITLATTPNGSTTLTERLRINATGNVGIGTTGPDAKLDSLSTTEQLRLTYTDSSVYTSFTVDSTGDLNINATGGDIILVSGDNLIAGNIYPNTTTSYNIGSTLLRWGCIWTATGSTGTCASDARLKTDIQPLDFGDALSKINQLKIRSFKYLDDQNHNITHGLVAQEVLPIAPELVSTGNDGYYQVNYSDIQWLTLQAIQEQQTQIDKLGLTETGDVILTGDSPDTYAVATIDKSTFVQTTVDKVGAFAELAAAKIRVGLIETREIIADRLTARVIKTEMISPLQGDAIFIEGNVRIAGDATVSGTLTASKIESATIDKLREKIETLADNFTSEESPRATSEVLQPNIDVNTLNALNELLAAREEASNSADYIQAAAIDAQTGFFSEYLAVLGQAVITDLQITSQITLTRIAGLNGSVDLAGNLNISGDLTVEGNVNILGELTAPTASFSALLAQKITVDEIKANQIVIAADNSTSEVETSFTSEVSTPSASITTNATAGKGTLPAGATEYTIYNPRVDANSLVYVTPTGDPQNQVLYVKNKTVGEKFTVAINQPLAVDLEFNWWIIKLE